MFKKKISKEKIKTTQKATKTTQSKKNIAAKKTKTTSSPTLEFQYISNEEHYNLVIEKIKSVKKTLDVSIINH
jgi:hypothetical protein